ncbi:MAG: orotidine 5'-phosphate decarboxylase / HUMPS family protein [Candidatus Hodarchaeales archaeon]|jgi:orotidine-5'-phosphate decarboxylase
MREGAKRIIFPLDVPSLNRAEHYVSTLAKHVGLFKIGLELFTNIGPQGVYHLRRVVASERDDKVWKKNWRNADRPFMLDLKLHDIPATVGRTVSGFNDSALGIKFFTVHAAGGSSMLAAAKKAILTDDLHMVAVTVLTSLDTLDLQTINNTSYFDVNGVVLARAELAMSHGATGVVAAPSEARLIKEYFYSDVWKASPWKVPPIVITPGIRLAPKTAVSITDVSEITVFPTKVRRVVSEDQKRVNTPYNAIAQGADYIVCGRPIRDADNITKEADKIADMIEAALKDKHSIRDADSEIEEANKIVDRAEAAEKDKQ